jgi:HlyD family secretion protein
MSSVPKSNRATQLAIWGLALVLILLAVYAVRSLTRERITVRSAKATYQDLVKSFPTNGKVEPMDDFQVHAMAAGQVQDVYVNVGDHVKAGQLLVKMDDKGALATLAHANSTVDGVQLALNDIEHGGSQDERNTFAADLSKATLQRQQDAASLASLQQLQNKGAASAGEVAAAKHRLELDDTNITSIERHTAHRYSEADKARVEAELADARASVAAAQSAYDNANIRSKIAGTVYYLPVAQYDFVNAGEDLVYVADLTRMRITAYFDEPDIGNLAAGQPVTITWEAKQGKAWHGHITQAPTTIISYLTRFVGEAFITVDDANGDLQPNANVNVTVTTAQHPHVLSVPREALRFDRQRPYVFRIVNNKLVRTPIQYGIVSLTEVEIVSGLHEGDTVALNATTNRDLTDGLEVTPVQ